MGLIKAGYDRAVPNATRCNTMKDIRDSHFEQNKYVTVKVNDIYGMLLLLGLGMGGAIISVIVEICLRGQKLKRGKEIESKVEFMKSREIVRWE